MIKTFENILLENQKCQQNKSKKDNFDVPSTINIEESIDKLFQAELIFFIIMIMKNI